MQLVETDVGARFLNARFSITIFALLHIDPQFAVFFYFKKRIYRKNTHFSNVEFFNSICVVFFSPTWKSSFSSVYAHDKKNDCNQPKEGYREKEWSKKVYNDPYKCECINWTLFTLIQYVLFFVPTWMTNPAEETKICECFFSLSLARFFSFSAVDTACYTAPYTVLQHQSHPTKKPFQHTDSTMGGEFAKRKKMNRIGNKLKPLATAVSVWEKICQRAGVGVVHRAQRRWQMERVKC